MSANTGGAGEARKGRVHFLIVAFAWMAGSSPAMTERAVALPSIVTFAVMAGSSHPEAGMSATTDPSVMPALEAGIHANTGGAGRGAERAVFTFHVAFTWMAGSSPAMTERSMPLRQRRGPPPTLALPASQAGGGKRALARHARPRGGHISARRPCWERRSESRSSSIAAFTVMAGKPAHDGDGPFSASAHEVAGRDNRALSNASRPRGGWPEREQTHPSWPG